MRQWSWEVNIQFYCKLLVTCMGITHSCWPWHFLSPLPVSGLFSAASCKAAFLSLLVEVSAHGHLPGLIPWFELLRWTSVLGEWGLFPSASNHANTLFLKKSKHICVPEATHLLFLSCSADPLRWVSKASSSLQPLTMLTHFFKESKHICVPKATHLLFLRPLSSPSLALQVRN